MAMKPSSFSLSQENIEYIDDQWKMKGKRSRSHWLDDLITFLREKELKQVKPEKRNVKRFTPPSLNEASDYFKERGCFIDMEAERFMDFYEMKGWMVGKNKMKDWKAAVRNWLKNCKLPEKKTNPQPKNVDSKDARQAQIDREIQELMDFVPYGK